MVRMTTRHSRGLPPLTVVVVLVLCVAAVSARPAWAGIRASAAPKARFQASMVYDPATRKVLLFGGDGASGPLGDTWNWDGRAWTMASGNGVPARSRACVVYDAARGRVVLFGGFNTSPYLGDAWTWDGVRWTRVPGPNPPRRDLAGMEYDSATGQVVLFGGRLNSMTPSADSWTWSAGRWTKA